MSVICLEGASAVGKTTTCRALAEKQGAFVVPEMNRLFRVDPDAPDRPSFGEIVAGQPPGWYLERQRERWTMARNAEQAHGLAVLDRDPFQPLWYRWAYRYAGGAQTLLELRGFYRLRIAAGTIRFPDGYVLLQTDAVELRRRKEADTTRDRRGFDKQLGFVDPQKRYFAEMNRLSPGRVCVVDARSVEQNVARIVAALPAWTVRRECADDLALFDGLTEWLADNEP